jgi:ATP-binding cassette subfamily B (MDR/TAP) protein 1
MGNFFQFFGSFLLCFILAMIKSPVLSLVTLSTIPLVVIVQIVTQVVVMPIFSAERRGFAEASTNVERSTNAISTVKAHNAEQEEVSRFNAIVERVKGILVKQAVVWAASESLTDFLLLATFVSGFWYGAALVRQGKLQGGAVMTVFWACLLASSYLQQAVPTLSFITKGKMSMASMLTVIQDAEAQDTPPKAPSTRNRKAGGEMDISSPISPDNSPSNSTFRPTSLTIPGKRPVSMARITPTKCIGEFNLLHVSFAYPSRPENPVLRDITLFIPPGETTFIVGGSGSGKSTIAQLLLRLYNPDGGEITLDDQSFPYLDEAFTRSNIAAVQQGCILFDMSVHDNVALGLAGAGPGADGVKRSPKDVSREEVEEACKMAMIHDFIVGLPEGYETRLGTGGSSLSGGQRQRLAIARARIRDPSILILGKWTLILHTCHPV